MKGKDCQVAGKLKGSSQHGLLEQSPVRQYRKRARFSLRMAAERAKVGVDTWLLSEYAVFTDVPPAIMSVLIDWGANASNLENEYYEFQTLVRENTGSELNWELPEPVEGVHPFQVWRKREGFSRVGFAKQACVNQGVIYQLETGKRRHLPAQLVHALEELGAPHDFIVELEFRSVEEYVSG